MKIVYLKSNNIDNIFNQLQQDLGGNLVTRPQEYNLILDNKFVRGEIRGISFKNNLSFMEFDLVFNEDTVIINNMPVSNPIHFMYCAKGKVTHSFGIKGEKRLLNQFQTGIFSCDPSKDTTLFFEANVNVKISNIMVDTHKVTSDNEGGDLLQRQILKTFMPKKDCETFAYTGSFNLQIAERMQELEAITQKGLVRNLLIQGIVHLILAMEIQQHKEDKKNVKNNFGSMNKEEIEDIKEMANFIKNYPEIQYSLKYLSSKTGLSPAKLQEGFKLLFDRTVTDYIRNTRIETAEHLIKTSDLNISEIVYSVGLTSRSYFSKIFKEKYNCSPKYYQDHQNPIAVTA
ncbi:AraC family transcriptional regulator [Arenibacter sp. TNZ]|uniref:helix-turn-helix domain-containing protein n=1 Tax=Arenibacter TaxID=178469 RepID=UPI000CD3C8A8|nr:MULTISPECIES: helix-turn-helix transcriptional regulator [Arenibacter]MCM4173393.1 AraC family transcriptional regulator [Arenibacter sp. TNZ]